MVILTAADYDAVRAALGVDVDDLLLPDETIAMGIYEGAAEIELLARVPAAATLTGTAAERVRNAAILLTAALIAPAMPAIEREIFGEHSLQQRVDWPARASQLRQRAEADLNNLYGPASVSAVNRAKFARAPGGRGL